MYQTVIFDLDGTLLDTLQDLAAAGNHTLSALGLPTHPTEAYRAMVGNGIANLVKRMLPEAHRGESTFTLARSMFESYYSKHVKDLTLPYPGIETMLRALKSAGVQMGVASNKADAFTQAMVADYFPKRFGAVAGLRDDFMPKPDPGILLWLMQSLRALPAATLYVGDSDVDMRTAMNAGLAACGVLWGFRDRPELEQNGARYIAEDVPALQKIILEGGL